MCIPSPGYIPCRQPSGRTTSTHTVGTLITSSSIQRIFSLIRISCIGKESCTPATRTIQRIVITTVFDPFFKEFINIVRYFTHAILHSPTLEITSGTIGRISFHTGKEVRDMSLFKYMIPTCGSPEVISQHLIIPVLINTTFG